MIGVKGLIFNKLTGKFLLLEKNPLLYPDMIGTGTLEIPGGRLEGEELENMDLQSGLKRELFEETGLEIDAIEFIELMTQKIEKADFVVTRYTFLCIAEIPIDVEIKLSDEHSGYRWVDIDELLNLDKNAMEQFLFEAIHDSESKTETMLREKVNNEIKLN